MNKRSFLSHPFFPLIFNFLYSAIDSLRCRTTCGPIDKGLDLSLLARLERQDNEVEARKRLLRQQQQALVEIKAEQDLVTYKRLGHEDR